MPKGRNKLIHRPAKHGAGTTDVLSDLLDTLRLATLMYGRFEVGAPWGFRLPDEKSARIIVVVRGAARVGVAGSKRPLALSAGDLALLPHGGPHTLRDADGSPLRALGDAECRQIDAAEPVRFGGNGTQTTLIIAAFRFRATHRTQSIQRLARAIHIPAGDAAASPSLASAMQLLAAESATRAAGSAVIVNRLADVLLVQAIRAFIARSGCPEHGLRSLADPQIGRAIALIHERPGEPWTVESLGAAVALSRSGFAARFSELVGETPLEYLAQWRMTKAAQLLRESDLSIAEVAERVGYQSEASFNRAFKRLEGVTPGAYRRGRDIERHE
jgi:AraC-like DNA-binding protein/mannose-6-phosphate isomerase-like protein (cupin superfamily)